MEFVYKNVLIWGYGVSGKAVEKILIDIDVDYKILDENDKINGGGFISKIDKKELQNYDLIVVSPGVDISRKEFSLAKEMGIKVISEIEFGYMFLNPKTKVIAVTGTNGKTTTVNMIYTLLKLAGKKVVELGNIGNPFSEIYKKSFEYVVLELSSFQLELCEKFKANIAVILNIAPDHIDRHKNFENYYKAKLNIFNNQTKSDVAIINGDESFFADIDTLAKKICFSTTNSKNKYYISNSKIFKLHKEVLDLTNFNNISAVFYQDVLSVFVVAENLGIDIDIFVKLLTEYKFLSHRCEFVSKINNVKYFNDSKATNIHAVDWCIKSLHENNIMLLLGGQNKGLNFKDFIVSLDSVKVKKIIAFGKAKNHIFGLKKFNKNIQFIKVKNLKNALMDIEKYLEGIDTVLLSPGCASFDEFKSYMERGNYFKSMVMELKDSYEKKAL